MAQTLLERLRTSEKTKQMVSQEYLGVLPSLVYAVQLAGDLMDYRLKNRAEAKSLLEQSLTEHFARWPAANRRWPGSAPATGG